MLLKKLTSIFLTLAMIFGSMVSLVSITTSASGTNESYVIWDANPLNVTEEEGATAKPTWDSYLFGSKTTGQSAVRYGGEMPYYELTFTGSGTANGALISSGFKYYWYNDKLGFTGWISHRSVLEAIKPYLYISYEVYVEDGTDNVSLTVQPQPKWGGDPTSDYGTFDEYENIPSGEWIERTVPVKEILHSADGNPHWSDAAVLISIDKEGVSAETPVKVSIRKLCLEIREEDREEVNSALAEVENIDKLSWFTGNYNGSSTVGDFPKQESGVLDYFEGLATYDAHSEYSPNLLTINDITDDENGNISISDTVLRAGETAVVTAFPKEGYRAELVTVISDEGKNILINRIEENKYSFAMPSGNVTVKAVFAEASENDNVSYVIWEADPKRFSLTDGTDASPSWTGADTWNFGSKVTGNSKVRYDEAIPYYEIEMTSAGETGGAVIDSGFVNTGHNNGDGFLGWVQSRKILEAMQGYLTVSYDIYVEDASGREVGIKIGPQPQYTNNSGYKDYGTFDTYENIPANIWISRTATVEEILHTENGDPHWACGDVIVSLTDSVVGVSSDSPITVRIRNLKLTVKEGDRAQLSSQLSAVEGIDAVNWFTLQWDGKTPFPDFPKNDDGSNNHYSALTAYDKVSAVATTFEKGDVNQDGAVDLKDLVRYKKYAADFTVKVNYSAADCDLNGSIEKAVDITALKKLLINGK